MQAQCSTILPKSFARLKSLRNINSNLFYRGGRSQSLIIAIDGFSSNLNEANGKYTRASDINSKMHFEKHICNNVKVNILWSGSKWLISKYNDSMIENALYFSNTSEIRFGVNNLFYNKCGDIYMINITDVSSTTICSISHSDDILGLPKLIFPAYVSYIFEAISIGLVMPMFPFFVLDMKGTAKQLSYITSINFLVQIVGSLYMGKISDSYGRHYALTLCLLGSTLSYLLMSFATSIPQILIARLVSGILGGILPVLQAIIADVVPAKNRPKYFGRIPAAFGVGLVVGPMINNILLSSASMRYKFRVASLCSFIAMVISLLFFSDTRGASELRLEKYGENDLSTLPKLDQSTTTNRFIDANKMSDSLYMYAPTQSNTSITSLSKISPPPQPSSTFALSHSSPRVPTLIQYLIVDSFLLMFSLSTENIYGLFLKDVFRHDQQVLSKLIAVNGLLIGLFQVFCIKSFIDHVGEVKTLLFGHFLLSAAMIGIALIRYQPVHFVMFTLHILAYVISDTALISLISTHSSSSQTGYHLSLAHAAHSIARILSTLCAGVLYQVSDIQIVQTLPLKSLPYLVASLPAVLGGIAVPFVVSRYHKLEQTQGNTSTF